jgi:DNA polymerase
MRDFDSSDLQKAAGLLAGALRARLAELEKSGIHALPRVKSAPPRAAASGDSTPSKAPSTAPNDADAPAQGAIEALLTKDLAPEKALSILEDEILGACTRCRLHGGRRNIVFGVGNPQAEVVFVGEGPGANEDAQGEPFVGRAGELLTRMIEAGMGYGRSEVYICNVVKCRPPNNRDPEVDEVAACEPFLKAQLALIKPRVIVTLGRYASQCLLQTQSPMGRLRGRWASYEGIDLMPTWHPSYLLRTPAKKREAWEDLKMVLTRLGRPIPDPARKGR